MKFPTTPLLTCNLAENSIKCSTLTYSAICNFTDRQLETNKTCNLRQNISKILAYQVEKMNGSKGVVGNFILEGPSLVMMTS